MSEYSEEYCPVCKTKTPHESNECMVCLENECKVWSAIQAEGIFDGSIILSRNINTSWRLSIFTGVDLTAEYPFLEELPNRVSRYQFIAPWTGETELIGTKKTITGEWSLERISKFI